MSQTAKMILRISLIVLLTFFACLFFPRRTTEAEEAPNKPNAGLKPASTQAAKKSAGLKSGGTQAAKKSTSSPSAEVQTLRNVGKAYYEQGKYVEAIEEFQKVIAAGQALATDHLNLGLALMQANKLDEALGPLTTAKQMDPKLVAADYNLGILFKRELRYPDAEAALKRVIDADPREPAAWFNLGTVYSAQRKLEDALGAHQHVVEMGFGRGQNFYVASLFHSFTTLVRLKRQAEAQKFLQIHEKMRDAVPGISLQNPALEGGKYGAIAVPSSPTTTVARRPAAERVTFLDITAKLGITLDTPSSGPASEVRQGIKASDYSLDWARRSLAPLFGPSLVLGDYDNDGRPDVYVVDPSGSNRLYHNNGDGTFTDVTAQAGVAGPGASLSATFADYTNSGHAGLFVVGVGGVRLYRNNGDGTFVDETEKAKLQGPPGELATRAVLFDADNDGFLDLLVTVYADLSAPPDKPSFIFPDDFPGAQSHFYRNNGDGTFSDVTASSGLAVTGRARKAVFGDFDNDGYTDALVLRDDAPPALFLGRGECKFVNRTAEAGADLTKSAALDAQVVDFNHDGNFDLALWSSTGYQVLLNRGGAKFAALKGLPAFAPPQGPFAFRGTVADLNGDSFDDLLILDADGKWHWIANRAGRFQEATLNLPLGKGEQLAALTPTWLGSPGKLNLAGVTRRGHLTAFEKEGPPARWLEVKMNGFKSNMLGVGSIVELKAGNFYQKLVVTGDRVRVYTGDLPKLDVVRVTWPNAVVQNWVNVATNKPIEVRESERLASSCPLLYAWDGARFVFLTDVLGVAPLGELQPDGSRIKPYPEEFVRLPEGLRTQDGMYVFQLTDELREVDYFDQVRLVAVDHPATEEIYANEIFSSAPSSPTLHAIRQKHFPLSAVDDHGSDVLPLLRAVDGRYPTDFRRNRILGLADVHTLTLDLGAAASSGPLALWLTGWVFWTDSNASRALMSNSQLQLVPPYLQTRDEQGKWVTVIPDMGLPSGTNRTMRLDLTGKFLSRDRQVRIVTNFCVYWDQIFFTTDEGSAPAPVELPLAAADLHYRGFSTPTSDPAHLRPDWFDYTNVLAEAPWNPMFGNYTRYGDTVKLVSQADDRLVVMATGDELTVKFDARHLPPLRPGWQRTLFHYAHGWAKDGEPNTAFSQTVDPMPFRQMSNYPYAPAERFPDSPDYQQYRREYQTRPRYLLIAPLAPPR
ncbi:MAG: FG-GAP-like repeat-containing protein [Terriglobia bacterium]